MRIFLILTLIFSLSSAVENVSLARTLMQFQGDEYNMLFFPMEVVVKGKKRKTVKAITKGYKRAIQELKRQVRLRDINLHMKYFSSRGSNLPQYIEQDKQTYHILKNMMKQQIELQSQILADVRESEAQLAPVEQQAGTISADDIDVEVDDSAFDTSSDEASVDDGSGNSVLITPEDAFISGFIEFSELYDQEVLQLYNVWHPFNVDDKPKKLPVNAVFGMAFFPTKYGSVKMMRIYIILCIIGTEEDQKVNVIVKEIPNFKWDRNYLYISAATGKVLRQIIAGVLGETIE